MSEALKGEKSYWYGKKLSLEHRYKLSEAQKGEKSYCYGKKISLETRRKMSEAKKGKKLSLEHRYKLSEAQKGRGKFGFTGVNLNKNKNPERKCWRSTIRYNNKNKSLGMYHDPLSAEIVFKLVRNELYRDETHA